MGRRSRSAEPLRAAVGRVLERKIELLHAHFGTQRSKDWFDAETFRGLARLRGMECRAPERYAEAFLARKHTASPDFSGREARPKAESQR